MITDKKGITNRWAEYFEELLKEMAKKGIFQELVKIMDTKPCVEDPTIEEAEAAILKLKNNKAPDEYTISAELIKHGGQILLRRIHK
jgi:hypothetical protein